MSRTPPPYIPAEIIGAPLDFIWEGPSAHAGPMQTLTPLVERLSGTTTCAQLTMCAGIVEWAAWRLQGHTTIDIGLDFAEAAFAYQVDQRYADHRAGGCRNPTDDDPPALGALLDVCSHLWRAMGREYAQSYYQPIFETFHAANITRHIIPAGQRQVFENWLAGLSDRVHAVAPKPDEEFKKKKEFERPEDHKAFLARHWGLPLPREILDPAAVAEPAGPRIDAFLRTLDPSKNPFLRTAEQMQALGFVGDPYPS
jgi:hypothetical protein